MYEPWTGIAVGMVGLAAAVVLVIGHYRREMMRRRQLTQMDHHRCWELMRHRR